MQAVPHWYEICGVLAAEITEYQIRDDFHFYRKNMSCVA